MTLETVADHVGLVPARSIRHDGARALVEEVDGLAGVPRALRAIVERAPERARSITTDKRLSQAGIAEQLREAGTDAVASVVSTVKPHAARLAGQLSRSLVRRPANTDPITRLEFMDATGATKAPPASFAVLDELALLERLRDHILESDASTLSGELERAATAGDLAPFFAVDSLPEGLHRRALGRAMLDEARWARLRGRVRAARDPEGAAETESIAQAGLWLLGNANSAVGQLERGSLTITTDALESFRGSLEDLREQLARVGRIV